MLQVTEAPVHASHGPYWAIAAAAIWALLAQLVFGVVDLAVEAAGLYRFVAPASAELYLVVQVVMYAAWAALGAQFFRGAPRFRQQLHLMAVTGGLAFAGLFVPGPIDIPDVWYQATYWLPVVAGVAVWFVLMWRHPSTSDI